MVLSNKKLKQKLRAEFAKKSLSKDIDSTKPTNVETPNSVKQLIDSVTQKPRLSKREKRREILSSTQINGESFNAHVENISKGKKRKRDKKGDENGGGLDGNVVKDQNNVVENGGGDMELSMKEGKAAMKKKKAKKNKKKKKKKSKSDKQENQAELPNEVLPQQIVAETRYSHMHLNFFLSLIQGVQQNRLLDNFRWLGCQTIACLVNVTNW